MMTGHSFQLFDHTMPAPEISGPAADRVLSGKPVFTTTNQYESADGTRCCGTWHSTTGAWRVQYDEWEYCHILSGHAVIRDEAGNSWEISVGDSFVIEPGFSGSWTVIEPITKLYTILL